jgi:dienelactone hydrolase
MIKRDIAYRDGAGNPYAGFFASPDAPTGPAILLAHNAPRLGAFERTTAERLAALGYSVFCADYSGGIDLDTEEGRAAFGLIFSDTPRVRDRAQAALAILTAQAGIDAGRIAAIGYCFGGTVALELARSGAELQAVVGLHAGLPLAQPEDNRAIKGKVLLIEGTQDPIVPPAMRASFETQMDQAGVDWRLLLLGGVSHGFTVPGIEKMGRPGIAYNQAADQRSWEAMMHFLGETIGIA